MLQKGHILSLIVNKLLQHTVLSEVSPKKEFVPRIKPGCLFPSLSDIESQSEAVDSQDEDDIADSRYNSTLLHKCQSSTKA